MATQNLNGVCVTDSAYRPIAQINALNQGNSTSHDADSNVIQIIRVDGRNWPTTFTIDALNRTSQTLYIDNTRVTDTWDAANQQIISADVTGITSFIWDNDSRKIATQNPTGINLTSTLDALGNRLVLQDNYGSTTNTWDSQSRLLSIWNPYNERTTMQWDPLNREQHRVLANGMAISHTWDQAGRETLIQNLSSAGAALFVATNTYSPVDNRLTVLETDGTRATYSYDASKQILSEARGGTMAYSRTYLWDPNGNRLQQSDNGVLTTGTFNASNQLTLLTPATGSATSSYYDGAGNLIGMNCGGALTTQVWTPENRLASYADAAGNSEQFLYSQDGLKKQRINGSGTTLFTYDESALLLETNTSGVVLARYTNGPETWGGLASQSRSGVSSFYGLDSQMSARILVSMAGVVTDSYSWKAFGEAIQSGSGTVNPYGYVANGLYYTELVDLINAWNNWLKASVGRWDSREMFGAASGDPVLYIYCDNDPVSLFDPTGAAPIVPGPSPTTSNPFPLTAPNATCAEVGACLGAATPCGSKFPATTPATMACIFWQEGKFSPTGNSNPKGSSGPGNTEGMGNLTLPAFRALCSNGCSSVQGFCPKPPKKATSADYHRFLGAKSTTPCGKAQAAYQYFTLVGLAGYGPGKGAGDYVLNPTLGNSVLDCADCLGNPFAYFCLSMLHGWPPNIPAVPGTGGSLPSNASCQSCLDLVHVYPLPGPFGALSPF